MCAGSGVLDAGDGVLVKWVAVSVCSSLWTIKCPGDGIAGTMITSPEGTQGPGFQSLQVARRNCRFPSWRAAQRNLPWFPVPAGRPKKLPVVSLPGALPKETYWRWPGCR